MAWTIEYAETALKQLQRLDRGTARRIVDYLDMRIGQAENPRRFGKALSGPLGGLWRYRVGDYRIICKIEDEKITVLVAKIAHRRKVYD